MTLMKCRCMNVYEQKQARIAQRDCALEWVQPLWDLKGDAGQVLYLHDTESVRMHLILAIIIKHVEIAIQAIDADLTKYVFDSDEDAMQIQLEETKGECGKYMVNKCFQSRRKNLIDHLI